MEHIKKEKGSILSGPIARPMTLFVIPIVLTAVLQQLFNTADLAVIGIFVGDEAQAAVGDASPVANLFIEFFLGFSVGVNVVIARLIGNGNLSRARDAMNTAILFSFLCGVFITAASFFAVEPLLVLMNTPQEILPLTLTYLRIYLFGMPFFMLYNFAAGVFRANGNSKTPLLCLTCGGALNLICNLLFVCVFEKGVAGVAIATVLSCAASAVLLLIALSRDALFRFRPRELGINRQILAEILRIGLPSGFLNSVFAVSNLCIQAGVNSLGTEAVTASTCAGSYEIYSQYVSGGFTQAATTFVGQNYGARNLKRADRCLFVALGISTVMTFLIGGIMYVTVPVTVRVFTSTPAVIAIVKERLAVTLVFKFVQCMMDITVGCMQGLGNMIAPATVSILTICGVRLFWLFAVFPHFHTMTGLVIIYPITQGLAGVIDLVCYRFVRRDAAKKLGRESDPAPAA